MGEEGRPAGNPLIQAFAPLHRSAMGTAVGIVLGTIIFTATIASMEVDRYSAHHIGLLSQYFVMYSVSVQGALIGLAWGFVTGFVTGWTFALFRNLAVWIYLVGLRSRADMEQYSSFIDHM